VCIYIYIYIYIYIFIYFTKGSFVIGGTLTIFDSLGGVCPLVPGKV
jgi:hypothetical protein